MPQLHSQTTPIHRRTKKKMPTESTTATPLVETPPEIQKCRACGTVLVTSGDTEWLVCPKCHIQQASCHYCGILLCPGTHVYHNLWAQRSKKGVRSREPVAIICGSCLRKENLFKCPSCNRWGPESEAVSITGYLFRICPICAKDVAICHACRLLVATEDMVGKGSVYCKRCQSSVKPGGYLNVNGSGFRPVPEFFGKEMPYYGIELEVDVSKANYDKGQVDSFCRNDCVGELNNMVKKTKAFYMKGDGSLHNGFEIVSQPHSLRAWEEQTWLQEACEIVKAYGGSSFNTGTCGVHVHRSRSDLTDLHLSMLIVLFVRLQPFFERVAQRKENGYCHYAFFQDGIRTSGLNGNVIYKAVKEKRGSVVSRYQAFNIINPATIECRIFRGTLCHGSILAYIKFMHWLCEFSKQKTTVLGKLLRYPVVDLWNMVAEFFTIDPVLTAYMQNKKVLLKGTNASQKVLNSGLFAGETTASST